jgi:DNA gyrase subunit A
MRGLSLKDNDYVEDLFVASTHDYMLFFTNKGKVYRLKVHELPLGSRTARGSALVNVLNLAEDEHPLAVISARDFPEDEYLMFATSSGMVKKTAMSAYDVNRVGGLIAIKLRADDELVDVKRVKEGSKVILTSTDGKAIMFGEDEVRPMGRDTSGVRGITLKPGATMLGMEISNGNGDLVVMTENGFGKRTPVIEYPEHKRGGQGVLTIAMNERKGALVACRVVGPQHELMIVSESGVMIRVKATDISKLGRATQGVRVMNLGEGDRVASMARMVVSKKKPPKRKAGAGEGQAMMDLALAGAIEDTDTVDEVDLGVEEFDESLLDD